MLTLHPISVINYGEVLNEMWNNAPSNLTSPHSASPSMSSSANTLQMATLIGEKVRLFAVLIGINSYPGDFPSLRGAVADVFEFKDYLETCLAVPADQIIVLTNELATRSAIIDALKDLSVDGRIEKEDAIFLYYAGHGTEMDAPAKWEAGGADSKIQAIVPYDCDLVKSGQKVHPIPDYTTAALLSKIAEKKGDNITVVFDCCHSASITRSLNKDTEVQVRSALLASPSCPEDLDQDIWDVGARSAHAAPKYRSRGLGSHTLISACGAEEQAKEDRGHGRFSSSLLKLLTRVSPENLRYSDILKHSLFPRIPDQNPQCEGLHRDRALFNAKVLPAQRKYFDVHFINEKGIAHYVVAAGTIQRITKWSEFTIYRKSDITLSKPIGVLVADTVAPFLTTTQVQGTKFDLTQPTIAILTKLANKQDLRLRIPPDNGFLDIYHDLKKSKPNQFNNIYLVDEPQGLAHIEVALMDPYNVTLKVNINNKKGGTPSGPNSVMIGNVENDPDHLSHVLSAACHFFGELENTNEDPDISEHIGIEFYRLVDDLTSMNFEANLQPTGPNLFKEGAVNLHTKYDNGNDIPYGIRVVNNSGYDLHANLFHFCPSDLSIYPCATSHVSGHHDLDISLKRSGGSLSIGYGNGGYPAISFEVAEGVNVEVGFLKIYLSTESVDLSYVQQDSPFQMSRKMKHYHAKPKVSWTDIIVPIIQRREPFPLAQSLN